MAFDPPVLRVTDPDGTYADRLTVVYRSIDDPVSNTDIGPSTVCVVDPHGALLDADGLRAELERLARGPDEYANSYLATERIHHHSWGADAQTVTFLISVGASVVAPFIVDGLKRISSAIAAAATYPAEARPITEREAKFWAEVMVGAIHLGAVRPYAG
jgi:hypothetical protein